MCEQSATKGFLTVGAVEPSGGRPQVRSTTHQMSVCTAPSMLSHCQGKWRASHQRCGIHEAPTLEAPFTQPSTTSPWSWS